MGMTLLFQRLAATLVGSIIAFAFFAGSAPPKPLLDPNSPSAPFVAELMLAPGRYYAEGIVELAGLIIKPGAVLLIDGDTEIHTTGLLVIDGEIRIRNGQPTDPRGNAPDLTLISDTAIILRGRVIPGGGAVASGPLTRSGGGTDLALQAPLIRVTGGPLRAGHGGRGPSGINGGAGGSIKSLCLVFEAARPEFACFAGNGGRGGDGNRATGNGGSGGVGGSIEFRSLALGSFDEQRAALARVPPARVRMFYGAPGSPAGQPCKDGGDGLAGFPCYGGRGGDGGKGGEALTGSWFFGSNVLRSAGSGGNGGHGGGVIGAGPGGPGGDGGACPTGVGRCAGNGGSGGIGYGGQGGNGGDGGNSNRGRYGAQSAGSGGHGGSGGNGNGGGAGGQGGIAAIGTDGPCTVAATGGAGGPGIGGAPGKGGVGGSSSIGPARNGSPGNPGVSYPGLQGNNGWIPYQPPK
jgi:hypothetical protein